MRTAVKRWTYLAGRAWLWITQGGFPVGLPARGASARDRYRRRAGRRGILRRWPAPLRPIAWLAMFPGWVWGAWAAAGHQLRTLPDPAASPGRGALWRAALRHNFSVREVVEYGLTRPDAQPGPWFCEREMFGIWEHLTTSEARDFTASKLAFAQFCAEHGLPHARTLAVWNRGAGDVNPGVWQGGVALKPMAANNAQGFEAWQRDGDTYMRDGTRLTAEALAARGALLSQTWGVMLAQPLLVLHPDLAALGLEGMPVARLITGQWPDGRVALLDGYFSAPLPGGVASNAGFGPKWPIEIGTGRIEASHSRVLPGSGRIALDGVALPGWSAAEDAVLFGHRHFPHQVPVLGWDVAFTTTGAVLLETNTGISLIVPQGTRQRPAGWDPIAELVDMWLRARSSA